jgi:hypothetical protein
MPPARRVRLAGHRQQTRVLGLVVDAVEREQVGDVAFLEADAAEFHPADFGLRRANGPAGLVTGDALRLPQAAQAGAKL